MTELTAEQVAYAFDQEERLAGYWREKLKDIPFDEEHARRMVAEAIGMGREPEFGMFLYHVRTDTALTRRSLLDFRRWQLFMPLKQMKDPAAWLAMCAYVAEREQREKEENEERERQNRSARIEAEARHYRLRINEYEEAIRAENEHFDRTYSRKYTLFAILFGRI